MDSQATITRSNTIPPSISNRRILSGQQLRQSGGNNSNSSRMQFISFSQPSNNTVEECTATSHSSGRPPTDSRVDDAVARSRHLELMHILHETKMRLSILENKLTAQDTVLQSIVQFMQGTSSDLQRLRSQQDQRFSNDRTLDLIQIMLYKMDELLGTCQSFQQTQESSSHAVSSVMSMVAGDIQRLSSELEHRWHDMLQTASRAQIVHHYTHFRGMEQRGSDLIEKIDDEYDGPLLCVSLDDYLNHRRSNRSEHCTINLMMNKSGTMRIDTRQVQEVHAVSMLVDNQDEWFYEEREPPIDEVKRSLSVDSTNHPPLLQIDMSSSLCPAPCRDQDVQCSQDDTKTDFSVDSHISRAIDL